MHKGTRLTTTIPAQMVQIETARVNMCSDIERFATGDSEIA